MARMAGFARWRLRALALLGLLLLAACASQRVQTLPLVEPERTDPLAPYEAADWPKYLKRLELPRERDYVILAYLPTKRPFDFSSPAVAQRSVLAALADRASEADGASKIGHTIVAWQCGTFQGMASQTGAGGRESLDLVLAGWGLIPVFSTYEDGHLYPEGGHKVSYMRALAAGRGVVTAIEVDRGDCLNLRAELTRYLSHPNQPTRHYSLLLDPRRYEGGGCISFAFYLAGAAGVMKPVWPHYLRDIEIRQTMIGTIGSVPPGVIPYRPPGCGPGCTKRGLTELATTPWETGPVIDRLRVPDGELVLAGLVGLRRGLVPADDWRFARVLGESDPAIAGAVRASRAWAAGYPVRRIADPEGVSALVLERR